MASIIPTSLFGVDKNSINVACNTIDSIIPPNTKTSISPFNINFNIKFNKKLNYFYFSKLQKSNIVLK